MDACGIVRALKNVVCGGIVKIGKADQNIRPCFGKLFCFLPPSQESSAVREDSAA